MARQSIGTGTTANDRTGGPLRTAFQKNNSNFVELYDRVQTLETSPNNVISVTMNAVANPRVVAANNAVLQATIFKPSISFTNVLYDDNMGIGGIVDTSPSVSGSTSVVNATDLTMRMSSNAADSGRLYCNFNGGQTGFISVYWNAKLFTRS